jgi:hypothetical protein
LNLWQSYLYANASPIDPPISTGINVNDIWLAYIADNATEWTLWYNANESLKLDEFLWLKKL